MGRRNGREKKKDKNNRKKMGGKRERRREISREIIEGLRGSEREMRIVQRILNEIGADIKIEEARRISSNKIEGRKMAMVKLGNEYQRRNKEIIKEEKSEKKEAMTRQGYDMRREKNEMVIKKGNTKTEKEGKKSMDTRK